MRGLGSRGLVAKESTKTKKGSNQRVEHYSIPKNTNSIRNLVWVFPRIAVHLEHCRLASIESCPAGGREGVTGREGVRNVASDKRRKVNFSAPSPQPSALDPHATYDIP